MKKKNVALKFNAEVKTPYSTVISGYYLMNDGIDGACGFVVIKFRNEKSEVHFQFTEYNNDPLDLIANEILSIIRYPYDEEVFVDLSGVINNKKMKGKK